jgi:hypothetical protein
VGSRKGKNVKIKRVGESSCNKMMELNLSEGVLLRGIYTNFELFWSYRQVLQA